MLALRKNRLLFAVLSAVALAFGFLSFFYYQGQKAVKEIEQLGINELLGEVIKIEAGRFSILAKVPEKLNLSDPAEMGFVEKTYLVLAPEETEIRVYSFGRESQKLNKVSDMRIGDRVAVLTKE